MTKWLWCGFQLITHRFSVHFLGSFVDVHPPLVPNLCILKLFMSSLTPSYFVFLSHLLFSTSDVWSNQCQLCIQNVPVYKSSSLLSKQQHHLFNGRLAGTTWVSWYHVAAWHSGNVAGYINEVTLRRARLVLGWVIVFGGQTTSVFHQATQANSTYYPQRDGKWVPVKVRWCSAAGQ